MKYSKELVDLVGDHYDEFEDKDKAKGECCVTTEAIRALTNWDPRGSTIEAHHWNDPDGRWFEYGQHSDHFAVYIKSEDLVVDYTLRQFDETTPFPFVGKLKKWKKILRTAWDTEIIHVDTEN